MPGAEKKRKAGLGCIQEPEADVSVLASVWSVKIRPTAIINANGEDMISKQTLKELQKIREKQERKTREIIEYYYYKRDMYRDN